MIVSKPFSRIESSLTIRTAPLFVSKMQQQSKYVKYWD